MNQPFSKIWIAGILVVLVVGGIFAWQYFSAPKEEVQAPEERAPTLIEYNKENLPRFEDFSILEKFGGTPVPVDLSSDPNARTFRTVLAEGAPKGPNFAAHYTVVTWGCGTMCQAIAVVDAKTGTVYFPQFVTELGSDFRIDSDLLIVNPPKAIEEVFDGFEMPDWVYTAYYKWENNEFITLYDTRIADWKPYRNEEYGFELKYPLTWEMIGGLGVISMIDNGTARIAFSSPVGTPKDAAERLADFPGYKDPKEVLLSEVTGWSVEKLDGLQEIYFFSSGHGLLSGRSLQILVSFVDNSARQKDGEEVAKILSVFRFFE